MGREVFPVRDRAEWLARRSHDLTASDIGAAAGVDPHKTGLQLWGEKTGQLASAADNPLMQRGRWLEPAVRAAILDENPGWAVEPVMRYFRDSELRLGASPDFQAITDEPGITNIQAKVVTPGAFEKNWANGPPLNYLLQTTCEGMLMDAARSILAALVIHPYKAELRMYPVPRHAAAEQKIEEIARSFWQMIAEGKQPAADYKRDAEVIEALHPTSTIAVPIDLTGNNHLAVILPRYVALKNGMAIDKRLASELEAEIKEAIGDHELAELPGFTISWKTQHRKEHVVKATSYRVLRVTDLGEDEEEDAA